MASRRLDGNATTPQSAEVRRALLWAFVYVVPLLLIVQRPVLDPDVWWHLRTGEWIVAHGTVPTTDPFAQGGQERPWMAYSWLFELLVYGLHQQFGLLGIVAFRLAGTGAVTAAVQRLVGRREPSLLRALGWTLAALLALNPLLQERSWICSILFYALTLDVLFDVRAGRPNRWTWGLPLVYVLWANLHIQFINGLFLLGLALGSAVLEYLLRRVPPEERAGWHSAQRRLLLLFLACLAATLVNPYTWQLYLAILELPTQSGAFRWLSELRALGFRTLSDWLVLGLTCLAAAALGGRPRVRVRSESPAPLYSGERGWGAGAGRPTPSPPTPLPRVQGRGEQRMPLSPEYRGEGLLKQNVSVFEVLLLTTGALFAFRAQRDTWLVVLPALTLLLTGPRQAVPACVPLGTWLRRRVVAVGLGTMLVLLLVCGLASQLGISEDWLQAELAKQYPVAATAAVEARGYPGPLYNLYKWGGYLIWRLPDRPVALDGRSYLHGDARMERAFHTEDGLRNWKGQPNEGWDTDPELTQARLVILSIETALASLLRQDRRFRLVYEDSVAVVFVARE